MDPARKFGGASSPPPPQPLLEAQTESYSKLLRDGFDRLFDEFNPIQEDVESGGTLRISLHSPKIGEPNATEMEALHNGLTLSAPVSAQVLLLNRKTEELQEQTLEICEIPLMTPNAAFVVNGSHKVIVQQVARSPGVYFVKERDPLNGMDVSKCYFIAARSGCDSVDLQVDKSGRVVAKLGGTRQMPATSLLLCAGFSKEAIAEIYADADPSGAFWETEGGEVDVSQEKAFSDYLARKRPQSPPNSRVGRAMFERTFLKRGGYLLGDLGRRRVNRKLHGDSEAAPGVLSLDPEDFAEAVRQLIRLDLGELPPDDVDSFANRRVKTSGEQVYDALRVGMAGVERDTRNKMNSYNWNRRPTPKRIFSPKSLSLAINAFFKTSKLAQFMDQINPLSELAHKRRLTAVGPGGLNPKRAGFEVRSVHPTHYGRICPIESPEGKNIGLVNSLASCARIDADGFILSPYRRVKSELPASEARGRIAAETVVDRSTGEILFGEGETIDGRAEILDGAALRVKPFVSDEVVWLNAEEEEPLRIAPSDTPVSDSGELPARAQCRVGAEFRIFPSEEIDFMDYGSTQIASIGSSLIPFLQHDDGTRALMGANMQKQATPLVRPQAPRVFTGMELEVAKAAERSVISPADGRVAYVSADSISVESDSSGDVWRLDLRAPDRSNQNTEIALRPRVFAGDAVKKGESLADGASMDGEALSLGQNLVVAFMVWEGYNHEDSIILNRRLLEDDRYTSVHIVEHHAERHETLIGDEEITADVPGRSRRSLRHVDENGIVRKGSFVQPGDTLVGKVAPKEMESARSPEMTFVESVFSVNGDAPSIQERKTEAEWRDTSKVTPNGKGGRVISVERRETPHEKETLEDVRVKVAQIRQVSVGDKMAGRHGNKGIVAKILPPEDMPFTEDGRPVDIILTPLGIPSRMNLGQIFESHLGYAAWILGYRAHCPVFDCATFEDIEDELGRAWLSRKYGDGAEKRVSEAGMDAGAIVRREGDAPGVAALASAKIWLEDEVGEDAADREGESDEDLMRRVRAMSTGGDYAPPISGKQFLRDGRTGEYFDLPVTVGNVYMLKLNHLVEDKIHARSIGPYSMITQQPLKGKAMRGGQRLGEMEVWAIEAYGASDLLREMLGIKSDDAEGRNMAYKAMINGENVVVPSNPESFHVLVHELKGLALSVAPV